MKVKTADLTGPALDWAVSKVEGCRWAETTNNPLEFKHTQKLIPHYSTDWSRGGPIIEREHIAVHGNPAWVAQFSVTVRAHHGGFRGYFRCIGPTPLIAAMRCFVASRLGDEVDVPDEVSN